MTRPNTITDTDVERWNLLIANDKLLHEEFKDLLDKSAFIEILYAGLWLSDRLKERNVPDTVIATFKYIHGQNSLGNDTWDVAHKAWNSFLQLTQ